jgi:hypothetical protein
VDSWKGIEVQVPPDMREDIERILGRHGLEEVAHTWPPEVDERAEPWNSEGTYPIYHFALENEDDGMNDGVYANGLLVETCAIRTLLHRSNMTLL